jgi:methanogenic corrinoid protein MtbC1
MSGHELAAEILEKNAAAYARQTCLRLETHLARHEPAFNESIEAWHADTMQRIAELVAALRLTQPELFVEKTLWLARAYSARNVSIAVPRYALLSLRETLLQDFPDQSAGVVLPIVDRALAALQEPLQPIPGALTSGSPFGKLALQYLATCMEGQTDEAIAMVIDAIRNGLAPQDVVARVIVPAQREIGNLWHNNEVSIAQEHLVTNTTTELMAVMNREFAKSPNEDLRVLIAGVSGNPHSVAIRASALLFQLAGWRSICLGTDLPPQEIAGAAAEFDVSVVVLSATMSTHVAAVSATIKAVREATDNVSILVGGQPFDVAPDLWKEIGADAMSKDIDDVVATAARLLRETSH